MKITPNPHKITTVLDTIIHIPIFQNIPKIYIKLNKSLQYTYQYIDTQMKFKHAAAPFTYAHEHTGSPQIYKKKSH